MNYEDRKQRKGRGILNTIDGNNFCQRQLQLWTPSPARQKFKTDQKMRIIQKKTNVKHLEHRSLRANACVHLRMP